MAKTLNLKATRVFGESYSATTRFVVNEGGTGSSKTYSMCQLFLVLMLNRQTEPLVFSVVRKTFPALRTTAMRDFFTLLAQHNLYDDRAHDKSGNVYRIGKCEIEFFSLDEPQKVRGRKRNYLWINEANELDHEDFFQLNIRTTDRVFLDYNPSDENHWIYDEITSQGDCTLIKSTFRDNPFLAPSIVDEIKKLQEQNPEHWQVYGLGERAVSTKTIFTNWTIVDEFPESFTETTYGLDFGFNHPTALTRIGWRDEGLYLREEIYERGLTNSDLILKMDGIVEGISPIYGDCAEPQRIAEIENYARTRGGRFNVYPSVKGAGSVKDSIDTVKRFKLFVLRSSVNVIRELKGYKWRVDKNNRVLDEPVPFMDDAVASIRYGVHSHWINNQTIKISFVGAAYD